MWRFATMPGAEHHFQNFDNFSNKQKRQSFIFDGQGPFSEGLRSSVNAAVHTRRRRRKKAQFFKQKSS
jgi:hypothetical protein